MNWRRFLFVFLIAGCAIFAFVTGQTDTGDTTDSAGVVNPSGYPIV